MREGTCHEAFGCPVPIAGSRRCKLCGKIYRFCKAHKPWATVCMNGHVTRAHPETLSDSWIDSVLDNADAMKGLRDEHKRAPELWQKLIDRLDARAEARKAN